MPEGLSPIDQAYFQGLAYLYARFRAGYLDRERGSAEKKQLLMAKSAQEQSWAFGELCLEHAVALWRDAEGAANAYARERTLEHADDLYAVVYGLAPRPPREG